MQQLLKRRETNKINRKITKQSLFLYDVNDSDLYIKRIKNSICYIFLVKRYFIEYKYKNQKKINPLIMCEMKT